MKNKAHLARQELGEPATDTASWQQATDGTIESCRQDDRGQETRWLTHGKQRWPFGADLPRMQQADSSPSEPEPPTNEPVAKPAAA
jgi:hypothetical protein